MTKRVEEIAAFMFDWLGFSQIESKDVEVVLRFPSPREKSHAIRQVKLNMHPAEQGNWNHADDSMKFGDIKVRFEAKPWGHE